MGKMFNVGFAFGMFVFAFGLGVFYPIIARGDMWIIAIPIVMWALCTYIGYKQVE